MSSDEPPHTPNDPYSDIDYSDYSAGSEFDLDFGFRGTSKTYPPPESENNGERGKCPEPLLTLCAKAIALRFPFEAVETSSLNIPEELQRLIAFHSFPTDEEDICLYACLNSGGSYEFDHGEALWANGSVKECVQIGFHLSATVLNSVFNPNEAGSREGDRQPPPTSGPNDTSHVTFAQNPSQANNPLGGNAASASVTSLHHVSLSFDRGRITSCSCTCTFDGEDAYTVIPPPLMYDEENVFRPVFSAASNSFSYSPLQEVFPMNRSGPPPRSSSTRPVNELSPDLLENESTAGPGTWCSHVVATCLLRIRQPNKVLLRAPISESLAKLSKNDLQKFAQNLICHVGPNKILPVAQKILDQLLDSADNQLKRCVGAPDPTTGGALGDVAAWCFNGAVLEQKLVSTLKRFWSSNPRLIYSDINSLDADSPIAVESFRCILHSLRGNDPRGVWDLLSIIGDMMHRRDNNGVHLLEIVTRCLLSMPELMSGWYSIQTKLSPFSQKSNSVSERQTNYATVWLCEEIVNLWRLVCLNPDLRAPHGSRLQSRFPSGSSSHSTTSRALNGSWLLQQLGGRLMAYHVYAMQQANAVRPTLGGESTMTAPASAATSLPADSWKFTGFKPALFACYIHWHSDQPPTHHLSIEEFRHCLPTFSGSRVTSIAEVPGLFTFMPFLTAPTLLGCHPPTGTEARLDDDPMALPALVQEEDELAFARFRSLESHGQPDQALPWARYLACRLLNQAPDFRSKLEEVSMDLASRLSCGNVAEMHRSPNTAETPNKTVTSSTSQRGTNQDPILDEKLVTESCKWANKLRSLLEQIRCLMESLTRRYNAPNPTTGAMSSVHRITNKGRSLLTYRGPTATNLHLDNTLPVVQLLVQNNTNPIRDDWISFDIELAFWLGLFAITLPRPPTPNPTIEVHLFDQEVALLNRMCCLPIHLACPYVLQHLRTEASRLANGSDLYHTDFYVPYTLATYLFHQLVGTYPLSHILDNLSNPSLLARAGSSSTNQASQQSTGCPVLITGAILAGSGLPLSICDQVNNQTSQSDLLNLKKLVQQDADLGFKVVLSVLTHCCRVPQSVCPHHLESQWTQRDALVLYCCQYYRDDVEKLDKILLRLLDRQFNDAFKAPPLQACVSLTPHGLLHYDPNDPTCFRVRSQSATTRNDGVHVGSGSPTHVVGVDSDVSNHASTGVVSDSHSSNSVGLATVSGDTSLNVARQSPHRPISPSDESVCTSTDLPVSSENLHIESSVTPGRSGDTTLLSEHAATPSTSHAIGSSHADDSTCDTKPTISINQERLPPQALSDAMAHHIIHLAKCIRKLAGGPSANESVFVAEPEQQEEAAHVNLQLVAFQIGLYALGVFNGLSPTWHSRNYSRCSDWIGQQAVEIGVPAACILYHSWQQHLTTKEVAEIALQLSRVGDNTLNHVAVELCLSSLTRCSTLRPEDVHRALKQCEEYSTDALERGLSRIEQCDRETSNGILPEILIHVARNWFSLYRVIRDAYAGVFERLKCVQTTSSASNPTYPRNQPNVVYSTPNQNVPASGIPPVPYPCSVASMIYYQQQSLNHSSSNMHATNPVMCNPSLLPAAPLPSQPPGASEQRQPARLIPPNPAYLYGPVVPVYGPTAAPNCWPHSLFIPGQAIGPVPAAYLPQFGIAYRVPPVANLPTNANFLVPVHPIPAQPVAPQREPPDMHNTDDVSVNSESPAIASEPSRVQTADSSTEVNSLSGQRLSVCPVDQTTLKTLEEKSLVYLRKAYQCAVRAIKKLFVPVSPESSGSTNRPSSSTSDVGRGRGAKNSQNRRVGTSGPTKNLSEGYLAWPGQATVIDSRGIRVPIAMDPQSAKEWDANILWTLDVARTVGASAVHDFCQLILLCIHSPNLMKEITLKVIEYFNMNRSSIQSSAQQIPYAATNPAIPGAWDPRLRQLTYAVPSGSHWHQSHADRLAADYERMSLSQSYAEPRGTTGQSEESGDRAERDNNLPDARDLVDKLINRTHTLFHKLIEQRLQYLGSNQSDWDEFVDLILKAYQTHLTIPPSDPALHWNNWLTRLHRHPRCNATLWERVSTGIQMSDLRRNTPG